MNRPSVCPAMLHLMKESGSWFPLITGVNFTNILWAAFAPKAFCHKITNPNCKLIKAAQRALVWLSILLIFYEQLFHTKVPCAAFMCLQFGFVILWQKAFGTKVAHKTLVKLTPGGSAGRVYVMKLLYSEKSQNCYFLNNILNQRKNMHTFGILGIL
jgi:hypothetical protein